MGSRESNCVALIETAKSSPCSHQTSWPSSSSLPVCPPSPPSSGFPAPPAVICTVGRWSMSTCSPRTALTLCVRLLIQPTPCLLTVSTLHLLRHLQQYSAPLPMSATDPHRPHCRSSWRSTGSLLALLTSCSLAGSLALQTQSCMPRCCQSSTPMPPPRFLPHVPHHYHPHGSVRAQRSSLFRTTPRCHLPLMPSPSSQSGFENSSPLSTNPSSSPPMSPSLTRFPSRLAILASCTPRRLSLPTLTPHTASTPLMLLRSPRHARSPEPSVSPMRSDSGILHYVLVLCLLGPHHTTLLGSSSHSVAQQ